MELAWWDESRGALVVEEATHTVQVGRSATDIRLVGALTVTSGAGGEGAGRPAAQRCGVGR